MSTRAWFSTGDGADNVSSPNMDIRGGGLPTPGKATKNLWFLLGDERSYSAEHEPRQPGTAGGEAVPPILQSSDALAHSHRDSFKGTLTAAAACTVIVPGDRTG